jgi:CheY-like chemotaxis protein
MPQIDGFEVAKEILAVNSHQRIIFASAHVKETLEDSIKQLKQAVELMQKPFTIKELIDTIEDKEVYTALQKLNMDLNIVRASNPTHEQIMDLLERLGGCCREIEIGHACCDYSGNVAILIAIFTIISNTCCYMFTGMEITWYRIPLNVI